MGEYGPGGSSPGAGGTDRIPERIDHYVIRRRIGRGGQGDVYLGHDPNLDIEVAIKVLISDTHREEFVERFKTEARTAVRLTAPNIVRVYNFNPDYPYLVMEFCGDGDLNRLVKSRRPIPVARTIDLIRQICEGLRLAHNHSPPILHRDLKPGNVLFSGETPKVADFGLAKMLSGATAGVTTTRGMMGTVSYTSPEQLKDASSVDPRTDLWSVGVMLYELLTFQRPFDKPGDDYVNVAIRVRMEPPAPPPYDVPKALWNVVERALQKEPDDRFQTAEELIAALDQAGRQLAESSSLELPPKNSLDDVDQLAASVADHLSSGRTGDADTIIQRMRSLSRESSLPRYWKQQLREAMTEGSVSSADEDKQGQAAWLESRLNSVRGAIDRRSFRDARRQIGELLVRDPDNSVVQQYLSRINDEEGRLTEAINQAHDAADAARKAGDVEKLFTIWNDLDAAFPDHPDITAELAVARRERKQAQRKVERDSVAREVEQLRGKGNLKGAIAAWDRYLADHPDDGDAVTARRALQQQRADRAREERLEQAERDSSKRVAAGDLPGAIRVWENCLAEDPSAEQAFARIETLRKQLEAQGRAAALAEAEAKAAERLDSEDLQGAIAVWNRYLAAQPDDDTGPAKIAELRRRLEDQTRELDRRRLELRRIGVSALVNAGRYASVPDSEKQLKALQSQAAQAVGHVGADLTACAEALESGARKAEEALAAHWGDRAESLRLAIEEAEATLSRPGLTDQAADGLRRSLRRAYGVLGSAGSGSADPLPPIEQAVTRLRDASSVAAAAGDEVVGTLREQATQRIGAAAELIDGLSDAAEWRPELDRLQRELAGAGADRLTDLTSRAEGLLQRAGLQRDRERLVLAGKASGLLEQVLQDQAAVDAPALLQAAAGLELQLADPEVAAAGLDQACRALEQALEQHRRQPPRLEAEPDWDRARAAAQRTPNSDAVRHWLEAGEQARRQGDATALARSAAALQLASGVARFAEAWEPRAATVGRLEQQGGATAELLPRLRSAVAAGRAEALEGFDRELGSVTEASGEGGAKGRPNVQSALELASTKRRYNETLNNPALALYDQAKTRFEKAGRGRQAEAAAQLLAAHGRLVDPPAAGRAWLRWVPLVAAALIVAAFGAWTFMPRAEGVAPVTLLSLAGERRLASLSAEGGAALELPRQVGEAGATLQLAPGDYVARTEDGVEVRFAVRGPRTVFLPPPSSGGDPLLDALGLGATPVGEVSAEGAATEPVAAAGGDAEGAP